VARFFISKKDIAGVCCSIAGEEFQHLRRVLRLKPGDAVTLLDDGGLEHAAVIRHVSETHAQVEVLRSYQPERESSLKLTLSLALTKGEKTDWVVEKATEMGVQTIIPFVSTHTVPKLDESKKQRRMERWQKIALSAVKQCGRTRVPAILPLTDFYQLLGQAGSDSLKLFFWEQETDRTLRQIHASSPDSSAIFVVIGPEGGFSSAEAALAIEHGFQSIHLGRRVLRAETAAIAAVALVQFLWGDLTVARR
jgi:16S rRNA (uracil1498-N3)-methyltransferase